MRDSARPRMISRRSFLGTALCTPTALVPIGLSGRGATGGDADTISRATALDRRAWRGLRQRLGGRVPRVYAERLRFELDVIKERGWARRFEAAENVVDAARRAGILVGPAEGMVSASLVAYALCQTWVDPVRHPLHFERFVGSARGPTFQFGMSKPDSGDWFVEVARAWLRRQVRIRWVNHRSSSSPRSPKGDQSAAIVSARTSPTLSAICELLSGAPPTPPSLDLDAVGHLFAHPEQLPWTSVTTALEAERTQVTANPHVASGAEWRRVDGFADLVPQVLVLRRGCHRACTDAYKCLDQDYLFARSIRYQWVVPHSACRSVVADTSGRILFDEQVMQLAKEMAGFDPWEADQLLRDLRQQNTLKLRETAARYCQGMQSICGVSLSDAKSTWQWLSCLAPPWSRASSASMAVQVLWICRLAERFGRSFARCLRRRIECKGLWFGVGR